jgi:hypothetical protein
LQEGEEEDKGDVIESEDKKLHCAASKEEEDGLDINCFNVCISEYKILFWEIKVSK